MVEPKNTLIVWDRIGDYHRARIRALESVLSPDAVFTADLGGADELYGWTNTQSGHHTMLSDQPVGKRDIIQRVRRFWRLLKDKKIQQVALAGYGRTEYVLFILCAWIRRCRIVLFAESWYGDNRIKNFAKGVFLKFFCSGFFVSGTRARDHFNKQLSIPMERLAIGYSAVDNAHFEVKEVVTREALILCVARFSPEKNLKMLLSAYAGSAASSVYRLKLIGDGPEEASLRELASQCKGVEFSNWMGYGDLPLEYARARYFVLPSRFEPWGLVVNEAMAAGLPVIASEACGCVPDLVDSRNGFIFEPGNEDALTRILDRLPTIQEESWISMSKESLNSVSGFDCRNWATTLVGLFEK